MVLSQAAIAGTSNMASPDPTLPQLRNGSRALPLAGRAREELPTPVMLLEIDTATRNIARMAGRFGRRIQLRPHGKSHKCVELARLQMQAGAIGLTVATAWEAIAFAHQGITDILVANEVVGPDKIALLATAAREARITVAVDDPGNVQVLGAAAQRAGSELGVLIDVDVGMARCGVRTMEAAVKLAQKVARTSGLQLRGVMGYEGHCALELDAKIRGDKVVKSMAQLLAMTQVFASVGLPVEIVSAGGTGTAALTGSIAGVTEIQAGSYVLMDNARRPLAPEFEPALTVLATVISRHGNTLVLDAGRKTIGLELASPAIVGVEASLRKSSDEHLVFETTGDCALRVGDRVELTPGYLPTTVGLHDAYLVMRGGYVVDIWPVLARGAGRPWVP
jgi:D-serine deaminase-like pyridoxal phosphate-dependent protein